MLLQKVLFISLAAGVIGHPSGCAAADSHEARAERAQALPRRDRNREIYYKNKLEFSFEGAWLPNNIPFVFDRMIGIPDRLTGLNYTLVPFIASVRWQMSDIKGPWIFRGNWEGSSSGTYTMIPRGPETRFWAYVVGIRRNFVQPSWPVAPYFEGRVGMGDINAKQPYGALYAQGQDLTFTVMLDAGARYNVSPRYALSAGAAYMHISNLYLSEPRYLNYGINVWGPMLGISMRLGGDRTRRVAKNTEKKNRERRTTAADTLP
jgi:hypothetical protein